MNHGSTLSGVVPCIRSHSNDSVLTYTLVVSTKIRGTRTGTIGLKIYHMYYSLNSLKGGYIRGLLQGLLRGILGV